MAITKRFFFAILTLVFTVSVFSQNYSPASWEHSVEKISDSDYLIKLTVTLQEGYSIYSQYAVEEDGFAPQTYFEFKNQEGNYKLIVKLLSLMLNPNTISCLMKMSKNLKIKPFSLN